MLVWQPKKPNKKPFPISEEGLKGLQKHFPGKYAVYSTEEPIKVFEVKKKDVVVDPIVIEPIVVEPIEPVKKSKKKIGDKVKKPK